jgi:hypothetical protein
MGVVKVRVFMDEEGGEMIIGSDSKHRTHDPDTNPAIESQGDAHPETQGDVDPWTQGDVDPGTQGDVDPGTQGDVDPGTHGDADPGTRGDADPGTQGEADPGTQGGDWDEKPVSVTRSWVSVAVKAEADFQAKLRSDTILARARADI